MLLVAGCNKNDSAVTPSNDQQVLGLVLQAPSQVNLNSLILLKDGRTISPVSGFSPQNLKAGNKFKLSFTPVATSSNSKIIDVHVVSYSTASDSIFTPPPSGGVDSTTAKSILQGTHSCTFTYSQVNHANPADTSKLTDTQLSIKFDGNTFSTLNPPALPLFIPGGEGIFFFTSENKNLIIFVNERAFPQEAPPGFILNNPWQLAVFDSYILIWKYGSFVTPQNIRIDEFSSFKVKR